MDINILKSNKGGEKLFFEGYGYHFRSLNKNNVYRWSCDKRKDYLCNSVVLTQKENGEHFIYTSPTDHNHDC